MHQSWSDKVYRLGYSALRALGGAGGLVVSWSLPAFAHGDDELHVSSFVGPLLALVAYMVLVGMGRKLIERRGGQRG